MTYVSSEFCQGDVMGDPIIYMFIAGAAAIFGAYGILKGDIVVFACCAIMLCMELLYNHICRIIQLVLEIKAQLKPSQKDDSSVTDAE